MDFLKIKENLFEYDIFYIVIIALMYFFGLFGFLWVGATKEAILICIGLSTLHMWSVTVGYHRYFSHKSFETSRLFQFILACLAQMTTQKGIIYWAEHHRRHHLHSDTQEDSHSPLAQHFFYSHMGWIFLLSNSRINYRMTKDLLAYPELVWLDKHDVLLTFILGSLVFLMAGWSGLFIGFFLSRVICWNITFSVNSFGHRYGTQRYHTGDGSRNNKWLALVTFGDSWHNNHHYYASSAHHGFLWWEIDISYYTLVLLSWIGLIWNIKKIPEELLNGHKSLTTNIEERSNKILVEHAPHLMANLEKHDILIQAFKNKKVCHDLESREAIHQLQLTAEALLESLINDHNNPALKKLPPLLADRLSIKINAAVSNLTKVAEFSF